jgi:hypothetical protein
MAPRTLEWHEAHRAVDLSDQGSHGSLVFDGDQPQLVPELMLNGDRCPLPSNPDGVLEGGLKSRRRPLPRCRGEPMLLLKKFLK